MAGKWGSLRRVLQRKRVYEPEQLDHGNLRRCLSVWDLTALGVGSSLGVGVYVLIGSVALHLAGPSIVLSFLIAAVAAIFAGLCYAEFGARVPKAGSAYIYTYVTVGEFVAFIIGWDMILEAVFGTASVARGLSMYVDSMTNSSMSAWLTAVVPISSAHFSPYFDFFSFLVVMTLGVLLAFGVRESSMVNNLFTSFNLLIIVFIILAGAFKADLSNWRIPQADVPEDRGVGGFFPYGVWGMLKGAAVCFYGFVGFDSISSTGEEVRDPRRAIPFSIMSTQVIVFLAYAGVAIVVTMMMPYYLQETVASVATSFTYVGWDWARWLVTAGAVVGITASLYGGMFPLPRLLYSMASDGLLFRWLARVTVARKSPTIATMLSAVVIALLAAILELNELILMMCVGTLLSYTIVAACVIILRYRSEAPSHGTHIAKQIFGVGVRSTTRITTCIINTSLILFICTCFAAAVVAHHAPRPLVPASLLHAAELLLVVVMTLQPQVEEELTFKTPLVPIIPCLSIYVNINLMVLIKVQTWIRVLIWIAMGIPVYIFCVCCYKQKYEENLEESINSTAKTNVNGKPPVQIYVVSPTPPGTTKRSNHGERALQNGNIQEISLHEDIQKEQPIITEQMQVQHAYFEDNEEKEAKIIDLLDQVLQAEEDSYEEIISLKEQNADESKVEENVPHRKSLSELSDAGSEASLGNQVLSKYDVIVQVHREDLPKLNEQEEKSEKEEAEFQDCEINMDEEEVTAFNDSDSRTDESGYSDTIDKTALNESMEDFKEDIPNIPTPPPLDESYFATPAFKKAYTISARPSKNSVIKPEEEKKRESVKSNNSYDDTPMVFGSDKQMNFMSKLENIFQTKMTGHEEEPLKRSNSVGNVVANTDDIRIPERPSIFMDLQKEIMLGEVAQNLRHINLEDKTPPTGTDEEETNLSREDLKSKLESIFAQGGPKPMKSRLMTTNPPTPEEAYQTDTSSSESIAKMPKMEKNDTLKRQKSKFGEVLNSFRLTLNKDDEV
ncbi:cationic amino acid transporter 2-like [Pararge aegeria]|uniref:Jg7257 protein n=1 Tax=Pararge aegeria aegeria TaxID=348720 RepID=A0A8S4SGL5_9NEOP|nr:cationic amino acid transporter 2-like [Pararge aegeria]XP_039752911.1 cationic amino acid transporter 2-like [Pararge aegeria]CAH2255209.1 jg7257 [Pararge aegeria aegeria]